MLLKLAAIGIVVAGFCVCYFGWHYSKKLHESDESLAEDELPTGTLGDYAFFFGVVLIFVGLALLVFG